MLYYDVIVGGLYDNSTQYYKVGLNFVYVVHTRQLSRFSPESPSFSWNLPVSRLEHQISRELPTVALLHFLSINFLGNVLL